MRIDGQLLICDDQVGTGLPGVVRACVYCGREVHMPDVAAASVPGNRAVLPTCPPCAAAHHPSETARVHSMCPAGVHPTMTAEVPVLALAEYLGALRAPDLAEYLAAMRRGDTL